ncbi:hypothetical protein Scep_005869 [Stephania cephalantha]|uniref:Uncharacterized protein n=1 Tax=Stephania cephalantha TaxID=152367 RepID=A0AAP0PXW7_9MAGN
MEDKARLAKARQELEELYMGVPDESVNLTFQDLAELNQQKGVTEKSQKPILMEPIQEAHHLNKQGLELGKSPSIEFKKDIQAESEARQHQAEKVRSMQMPNRHLRRHDEGDAGYSQYGTPYNNPRRNTFDSSFAYDESGVSLNYRSSYGGGVGRKRPGIPHSNICTICSTYIYMFRHRCMVCGRVYCRNCVGVGMGEMIEGRKCVECLGRKFSQRYIQRAGQMGCCMGYSSIVKQQELLWAEKGPRRSAQEGRASTYGPGSTMVMSTCRSPIKPRPRSPPSMQGSGPPSFVINTSPNSPTLHPFLFN